MADISIYHMVFNRIDTNPSVSLTFFPILLISSPRLLTFYETLWYKDPATKPTKYYPREFFISIFLFHWIKQYKKWDLIWQTVILVLGQNR